MCVCSVWKKKKQNFSMFHKLKKEEKKKKQLPMWKQQLWERPLPGARLRRERNTVVEYAPL